MIHLLFLDIKSPNKLRSLPFTKRDETVLKSRRKFLENYLQSLTEKSQIAQSKELQEFLGYGSDGAAAYERKTHEISLPRIDKVNSSTRNFTYLTMLLRCAE